MQKKTYFHRVSELTPTRFWINNVTRNQANWAIEAGATGCTQNPSYTYKMMINDEAKSYVMEKMDQIIATEKDDNEVQVKLQRELVGEIADIFLPLYEATGGKEGYVSIQGDPFKEDKETIIRHARFNREAGVNIMAKIPATEDGFEAIEVLLAEGVPINATEVMAVKQAMDLVEIYNRVTKTMENPPKMYISHIAGIFDEYLNKQVEKEKIEISEDILWQAGISVAKKMHQAVREKTGEVGFIGGGARGLHHFTEMVGSDFCVTINWVGTADKLIEEDPVVVQRFLQPTPHMVVDTLQEKLVDYKKAYMLNEIKASEYEDYGPVVLFRESFEKAWASGLDIIAARRG